MPLTPRSCVWWLHHVRMPTVASVHRQSSAARDAVRRLCEAESRRNFTIHLQTTHFVGGGGAEELGRGTFLDREASELPTGEKSDGSNI